MSYKKIKKSSYSHEQDDSYIKNTIYKELNLFIDIVLHIFNVVRI